jgi:hypothetical protein
MGQVYGTVLLHRCRDSVQQQWTTSTVLQVSKYYGSVLEQSIQCTQSKKYSTTYEITQYKVPHQRESLSNKDNDPSSWKDSELTNVQNSTIIYMIGQQ